VDTTPTPTESAKEHLVEAAKHHTTYITGNLSKGAAVKHSKAPYQNEG